MKSRVILTLAIFVFSLQCLAVQTSESDLTPLPGDPLRKQVLDTLRREVKQMHGLDVIFVVDHLKVKDGWAWVQTQPQSPDGMNHYESLSALLQVQNGVWTVVEIPCSEPENLECLDGPEYFEALKKRYPSVASEIFPE